MNPNVPSLAGQVLTLPQTTEQARRDGYRCLSPIDRAVAIEFATTGFTLARIARELGRDEADVKRSFSNPIVRAFIADLQEEIAMHKVINASWVEQQVLSIWPQLIGEEEVPVVTAKGETFQAKKFHSSEVASLLRHFSGNADQKKTGGVQVVINMADLGISQDAPKVAVQVNGV